MKRSIFAWLSILSFLLFLPACDLVNNGTEHVEAEGFEIYDASGAKVIRYFQDGIESGSKLSVTKGTTSTFTIKWIDADKNVITNLEAGASLHFATVSAAVATVAANGDWGVNVTGVNTGTTEIEIGLLHEGHFDFAKRNIPVEVK